MENLTNEDLLAIYSLLKDAISYLDNELINGEKK